MAATRRAQILMEPEEYARLEEIARQGRVSVAELIRSAIRDRYLGQEADRCAAARAICSMSLPIPGWDELETEVGTAHHACLP